MTTSPIIHKDQNYKLLSIISMISVCFLIVAMIFTYRIIEFGPFLTPGGVIPFAITYIIAGVVTEVYGYKNARILILGNFLCIFIFNILVALMLKLPVPIESQNYAAFTTIFNNTLFIMFVYSIGFLFGDLSNSFFVSKWKILLKGKYFFLRLIGASIIGQISFSLIVIPSLYFGVLSHDRLFHQFLTTITAKILIIIILSYPSTIIAHVLRKIEKIDVNNRVIFNPI